jgi:hypothetical protein
LNWNKAYKGTPPWDIGHAQPVFEALIKDGEKLSLAELWILDVGGVIMQ